eukprot:1156876-Pelagomonas_calceolata.AAC.22
MTAEVDGAGRVGECWGQRAGAALCWGHEAEAGEAGEVGECWRQKAVGQVSGGFKSVLKVQDPG